MDKIQIKRIYDDLSAESDTSESTYRVLVDRLWPRGISKDKAKLDEWNKEIAPSTELRKWFDHEEDKFKEFSKKYKKELTAHTDELERLSDISKQKKLVLLYGAKNENFNQAIVLQQVILEYSTK